VVRIVRPGVVFEGVDSLVAADGADTAPEEVAEVDDQVWGDALHLPVQLLRAVDARADRASSIVWNCRDPGGEIVPDPLVVRRAHDTFRLPPAHVQEHARVVAALAPGDRVRPVDSHVSECAADLGLAARRE
jgi:hypothetical protein